MTLILSPTFFFFLFCAISLFTVKTAKPKVAIAKPCTVNFVTMETNNVPFRLLYSVYISLYLQPVLVYHLILYNTNTFTSNVFIHVLRIGAKILDKVSGLLSKSSVLHKRLQSQQRCVRYKQSGIYYYTVFNNAVQVVAYCVHVCHYTLYVQQLCGYLPLLVNASSVLAFCYISVGQYIQCVVTGKGSPFRLCIRLK